METLRDIDVKNLNLMPWGMRYGHVMVDEQPVRMRLTKLAACPYCYEFSISSQGNFHGNPVTGKHAGNEWFNRVIGFQPSQFASTTADDPGIATIHCPRCGKMFGFQVPFVVIEAYMENSKAWSDELKAAEDIDRHKNLILVLRKLARALKVPNLENMTDMELLKTMDVLEEKWDTHSMFPPNESLQMVRKEETASI